MRLFSRGRLLAIGLVVASTAGLAAFTVTESTDYPGGVSFSSDPSVGTLDPGVNTVSGTLNGTCVVGDCNPGNPSLYGDTQDSFLMTVPAGYQISGASVTTSSVTGPANFSLSLEVRSLTDGVVLFVPFLSPLNGTTANLVSTPLGPGLYAVSVYGQQASAAGAFSLNWSVAMNLSSTSITPAQMVTNLIDLIANPNSGLNLTSGQANSLTDKLTNALASIQAGDYKQATNQLNAFISAVQTYLKNGKVSASTASTLTTAANAIITAISSL